MSFCWHYNVFLYVSGWLLLYQQEECSKTVLCTGLKKPFSWVLSSEGALNLQRPHAWSFAFLQVVSPSDEVLSQMKSTLFLWQICVFSIELIQAVTEWGVQFRTLSVFLCTVWWRNHGDIEGILSEQCIINCVFLGWIMYHDIRVQQPHHCWCCIHHPSVDLCLCLLSSLVN